ncbi:DUF4214 domain-containing protein [Pararhizobium haloflavum]|uniref:DUF4214 domain-containing protein n=1 Tax=Pararhizobium haloflavum TaxID=2037914 RepID=UPI00130001C3|nr:DUF4214 domain-containing protein [Pararhizobium haloflavum]
MDQTELTVGDLRGFLQFAASGVISFSPDQISTFFDQIRTLIDNQGQLTDELDAQIDLAEQVLIDFFSAGSVAFDLNATIEILAGYPDDTPLSQTAEFAYLFDGTDGTDDGDDGVVDPVVDGVDYVVGDVGFKTVDLSFAEVETVFNAATGDVTVSGPGIALTIDIDVTARVELTDGFLAFDIDGAAGQGYRIYGAAFDRAPDDAGLGYWIRQLDEGNIDLVTMSRAFLASDEFQAVYGSAVANSDFIELLYQNVLERQADDAGLDYWLDAMEDGAAREVLLASFSESLENKVNVEAEYAGGIFYV